MNLFEQEQQINPFEFETPRTLARDAEAVNRTARTAAMANSNPADFAQWRSDKYRQLLEEMRVTVDTLGDREVRRDAALRAQERDIQSFANLQRDADTFDPTGEIGRLVTEAASDRINEDLEIRAKYQLERDAIDNVQLAASLGQDHEARMIANNFINGTAANVRADFMAKRAVIQAFVDNTQAEVDKRWMVTNFVESFLSGSIPFRQSMGNVGNVSQEGASWFDNIFSGSRVRKESEMFDQMSFKELVEALPSIVENVKDNTTLFGWETPTDELRIWSSLLDSPSALETNAWDTLANLPVIGSAGRLAFTVPGTLVRAGSRKAAVSAVQAAVEDITTRGIAAAADSVAMQSDELVESLLPTGHAPFGQTSRVSLGIEAAEGLEEGRKMTEALLDLEEIARLTPDELATAQQAVVNRITKEVSRNTGAGVLDVEHIRHSSGISGTYSNRVGITLDKGFENPDLARKWAESLGFGDGEILRQIDMDPALFASRASNTVATVDELQDTGGLFFPRVIVDMPEAGFISNPLHVHGNNSVAGWMLGANSLEDNRLFGLARQSGNKAAQIMDRATNWFQTQMHGVKPFERETVSQIWKAGENKGVWFDKNQFDELYDRAYQRAPTDNEWRAYNTLRALNDFEYYLRNSVTYNDKVVRGVRTVSHNTSGKSANALDVRLNRVNAYVDHNLTERPKTRLYNLSLGKDMTSMSDEQWQALRSQGYRLVTVEGDGIEANGWTYKTFLARADDIVEENLRFDQIPYRAGGHRIYENPLFVKQARWLDHPDGTKSLVNPLTIANPATPAEASELAERLNRALALLKGDVNTSAADLDVVLLNAGGIKGDDLIKAVKKGQINVDEPFEALYDREKPSVYSRHKDVLQYVDEDATGFNGFLESTGRLYTSHKGEHLPDFYGNNAPTLDAFESVNMALSNVSRLVGWNEYRMSSVDRWVATARKYLNVDELRGDLSPYRIFQDGVFREDSLSATVRDGLEAQRSIIKRNLGWRTKEDLSTQRLTRQVIEWINGSDVKGIRNQAAKLATWASTKDPLQYAKGWAYDLKLGMFNPGQLILQSSTMLSSIALSPVHGARSFAAMPFMRMLAHKNFDPKYVSAFADKFHKVAGFDSAAEFTEFVTDYARSGVDKIKNTNQLIGSHGSHAAMDGFQTGVGRLREHGRFFLNVSEEFNQTVGYGIAWREAREQVFANAAERNAYIARRAENYTMNMKRESAAAWQRGIWSIPTQFWAYNMRVMEALMGNTFSPAQRGRLFVAQFMLSGIYGIPAAGIINEAVKAATGESGEPGSIRAIVERGLLDAGWYYATGADIEIGRRIGTGNFLPDMVKELFGMSQFGPTSVVEFLGGPTFSIGKGVLGSLNDVAKYAVAESGSGDMPLTREALVGLASEVSTIGNALKGLMILQYGTLVTNTGTTSLSGLPEINGWAQMIGFRPGQLNALEAMSMNQKDRTRAILDASKVIMNYRTRWVNEPENREDINAKINTFIRLLPEDIKEDALKKAHKEVDTSIYETYSERIAEQQGEEVNGADR